MGRGVARNMYSRNTNKVGIQCVCWFHSLVICHDTRSYDLKKREKIELAIKINIYALKAAYSSSSNVTDYPNKVYCDFEFF